MGCMLVEGGHGKDYGIGTKACSWLRMAVITSIHPSLISAP